MRTSLRSVSFITSLPLLLLAAACGVDHPPICSAANEKPEDSQTGACCSDYRAQDRMCVPDTRPICSPAGEAPSASKNNECCDDLPVSNGVCAAPDTRPVCSPAGQAPAASKDNMCCAGLQVSNGVCAAPDTRPVCSSDGQVPSASQTGACCAGLQVSSGVCKPPPADLSLVQFSPRVTPPASGTGTAYICLNRAPSGTPVNYGDVIRVTNVGAGDARPFRMAIGIVNRDDINKVFYCQDQLVDNDGLRAGYTASWTGPWCCAISVASVPTGYYAAFGIVDPDRWTSDTNERNDTGFSPLFYVP